MVKSDEHGFVGRIFDLSIVAYHFESYDELAAHPDCKYAIDVNAALTNLTQRVESLNLVGDMIWPKHLPESFKRFPVSRYDWLKISTDVFLIRYISIVDCALLLVNDVYELGLDHNKCSFRNIQKKIPVNLRKIFSAMRDDQDALRHERNARVHHGYERGFSSNDRAFRMVSLSEHRFNGVVGKDEDGRRINPNRSFKEGLVELQRDFNGSTRQLVRHLVSLYDVLWPEFEGRFVPRLRAASHGLGPRS